MIDEKKECALTNYGRLKDDGKATDTDHHTQSQYIDLDLKFENARPQKVEIFDFKKKISQEKFKEITSKTTKFTDCFDNLLPLPIQIQNWHHHLSSSCQEAFTKIRIKKKKQLIVNKEISNLIRKKNEMKKSNSDMNSKDIDMIDKKNIRF